MEHPDEWVAHEDWPFGCVCKWCRHNEEHHGVSRAYEARIERLELLLTRSYVELGPGHAPLLREIDAVLDAKFPWDEEG